MQSFLEIPGYGEAIMEKESSGGGKALPPLKMAKASFEGGGRYSIDKTKRCKHIRRTCFMSVDTFKLKHKESSIDAAARWKR